MLKKIEPFIATVYHNEASKVHSIHNLLVMKWVSEEPGIIQKIFSFKG